MKYTIRGLMILTIMFTGMRAPAFADWKRFMPTTIESHAYLEAFSSYEYENRESERKDKTIISEWSNTFLKEKLTFETIGFIYHPRFILYNLSLSAALKQEDYTTLAYEPTGWVNASGIEYRTHVFILPEHPYNLDIFAHRLEPIHKERSAFHLENVETSIGGLFKYRKKPYFFNMKYLENHIESSFSASDTRTYGANANYFKELKDDDIFSLLGAYTHSDLTGSSQIEGSSDEYSLSNVIDIKRFSLHSSVSKYLFDQESPNTGSFENDTFTWNERLKVKLPMNFGTELIYQHQKNASLRKATDTVSEKRTENTLNSAEINITHRLYQSLDNTLTFRKDIRTSTTSDADTTAAYLKTNYTKKIPRGRLLAGFNMGRSINESTGEMPVINELHTATPVPGSFVLNVEGADPSTISVLLNSPLPPFEIILLEDNIHYTVTPFGNTFEIDIINLPPQFLIPETYEFRVSYSVFSEDLRLQTDNYGFNVQLSLFSNIINPFYSYSNVKSEVLAGNFLGTPSDYESQSAGLIIRKGLFRARFEYQQVDSNINPYGRWKSEVYYTRYLTDTFRVTGSAAYSMTDYSEGTTGGNGEGYQVRAYSFASNIVKEFLAKHLSFSAGGAYSRSEGLSEASGYSLRSSLMWKIGKLALSLGANASRSESISATYSTITTNQYYYINIRRDFF